MWHTSRGDRTLVGPESNLISAAIDSMIDELLIRLDDSFEDDQPFHQGHYGLVAYDSLTVSQRVGILHDVARHLLTETSSVMPLSAAAEAAVAAIFIEIRDCVIIEIDLSEDAEPVDWRQLQFWRRMVLRAARDVLIGSTFAESSAMDATQRDGTSGELVVEDVGQLAFPEPSSRDRGRWSQLIDQLADTILWDRDFELADCFLDADPGVSSQRRRLLGIEDDYFTRVAPDPRPEDLEELVYKTRDIVRRKPR